MNIPTSSNINTVEVKRLPTWLRPSIGRASEISTVQQIIKQKGIHTICEEGRCPNRAECYAQKTATSRILHLEGCSGVSSYP